MKYFILLCLLGSFSVTAASEKAQSRSIAEAKVLIKDIVRKVMPQGPSDKVIFSTHAGIYYLRSDSKHYEAIKSALISSQKNNEAVEVKVDPTSMEIEEIVLSVK